MCLEKILESLKPGELSRWGNWTAERIQSSRCRMCPSSLFRGQIMFLEPFMVVAREFTRTAFLTQFALGAPPLFNLLLLLSAEMPKKIVSHPRLIMVVKCHLY